MESGTNSYPVRLSTESGWRAELGPATNPRRLSGSGNLDINATHATIHARKRALLGAGEPAVAMIDIANISDASASGSEVRFREHGEAIAWRLHAESVGAAVEIAAQLPARRTEGLAELADATERFEQQLGHLTNRALVSRTIVAVNVLVFVAMLFQGAGLLRPNPLVLIEWGSNSGPYTMGGEAWRLITSQFLHLGLLHLVFNMWALWNLGPLLERLLGSARFALLYLLAGAMGSLASVVWNPAVNSVGASGAVFGLLGALLALTMRNDLGVPEAALRAQRTATVPFLLYNLASGFVIPGIDNAAHIGGLIGGFLLSWALAQPVDSSALSSLWTWHRRSGPIVSVLLLAALSSVLLTPRGQLVHIQQLRRDEIWLLANEPRALRVLAQAIVAAERANPDRGALARSLEREAFPLWLEAARRFRADYPLPLGPMAEERAYFREGLAQRIAVNAALLKWVRSGDSSDRAAYDEQLKALQNRLVARMQKMGREAVVSTRSTAAQPRDDVRPGSSARSSVFDSSVSKADRATFSVFADLEADRLDARSAADRMEREAVPLWSALVESLDGAATEAQPPRVTDARRRFAQSSLLAAELQVEAWRTGDAAKQEWADSIRRGLRERRRAIEQAQAASD